MILREPNRPRAVAVADRLDHALVIAQRRAHRRRPHRVRRRCRSTRRSTPPTRAPTRSAPATRSAGSSARCRTGTPAPRESGGHWARSATRRRTARPAWRSRPRGRAPPRSIRSSRAAHMPAQIGSRCISAPLTSAGVESRDCSTMLIMCAVRSADGRCTTAPPTLPRRTEIRPSVSRMWMASRSAGGLTPNSPSRLSCAGSTSPSLQPPGQDVVAQSGRRRSRRPWVGGCGGRPRHAPLGSTRAEPSAGELLRRRAPPSPRRRRTAPRRRAGAGPSTSDPACRIRSGPRARSSKRSSVRMRRRPSVLDGQRPGLARQACRAIVLLRNAIEEDPEKSTVHQARRALVDHGKRDASGDADSARWGRTGTRGSTGCRRRRRRRGPGRACVAVGIVADPRRAVGRHRGGQLAAPTRETCASIASTVGWSFSSATTVR